MSLPRLALLLGTAVGLAEVALHSAPERGLGSLEVAGWALISVATAVGLATAAAALAFLAARWLPRAVDKKRELVVFVVAGVLGAINYRYAFVLNHFVRDPAVWLGMPAVACICGGIAAIVFAWISAPARALAAVAVVSAAAIPLRAGSPQGRVAARPNVLAVSMDTVRADAVVALPTFGRLARAGTVFTQAIASAPITEPSHLAMLSGIAPYQSGVVSNGTNLGDRPALVSHSFSREGYLVAGFVAGFPLHGKYGWGQGSAVWDDDFGVVPGLESLSMVKLYNQFFLKDHALRERSAERVLARAERWIRAHRDENTFTFVHFYDAHGPYHSAKNDTLGKPRGGAELPLPAYWPARDREIRDLDWLSRAYQAEVADVDAAVGRLLDALGPTLDNTIVVVTADHGESLTEHGYYFDHGDNLYDPSLRVPLVFRYPPVVQASQVTHCMVGGTDLAPTLLALVGISDAVQRDGISRVPELRGEACRPEVVISSTIAGRFVASPPVDHALRSPTEKLIRKGLGGAELYDLVADPGERRNLAPSPRSEASMSAFSRALEHGRTAVSPEMDAETRAALEALGYLGAEAPLTP